MKPEKWIAWQPLKKMTGTYYIKSCVNNDFCTLTIILGQYEQKNIELYISFDSVEKYEVTNETYKLKTWQYLSDTHQNLNRQHPLFIIEHSNFLNRISEESEGISDSRHLKHYCIMDSEWSIDIATVTEPIVEIMVDSKIIESSSQKYV